MTEEKPAKQLCCSVARDSSFLPCCRANSSSLEVMLLTICFVEFSICDILEPRLLLAVMVEALWASSFWWNRSNAVVVCVGMASIFESSFNWSFVKTESAVEIEVGFARFSWSTLPCKVV